MRIESCWLAFFLVTALLLRIVTNVQSSNIAHPDEIFQTQEPAHRLAYGYGIVTWEWRDGIRSWVFPAFLAMIMRGTSWLGSGSSGYLLGIIVVLSLVSLAAVWFAFAWCKRASGVNAAIVGAGYCAIWYELIFFAPRALTEVVATHILLPGLYIGVYAEEMAENRRMFLSGFLCGLALSLRIQLAPAVVFAAIYFSRQKRRGRILPLLMGLLLSIVAFGVTDAFTWSRPFQSFLSYFWVNIVEGRSALYGTQPWYWYLIIIARHLGPMIVPILIG